MLPFALCLQLAVSLAPSPTGTIVVYDFENRCDYDVLLDLTHVSVVGRAANGNESQLTVAEPPWRAFSVTTVDARTTGHEAIHYAGPKGITSACVDLTTATAAPPVCVDVGSVPILETQLGYGYDWSSPGPVNPSFDAYTSYESIQTRHLRLSDGSIGSFSAKPLGARISAVTLGVHPILHINPWLYVGADGAFGLGNAGDTVLGTSPTVTTRGAALHVRLGGVVGATSPRFGRFDVRGEVFGGGRAYLIGIEEKIGCTNNGCPDLTGGAWMVQPKAIVEAWLTPFVTLGAFGAADVLHPGDWATGIFVGVHQHGNDAGRK